MNEVIHVRAQATNPRDKILDIADLAVVARDLHAEGRKVVLCHGVFDLLHLGHVRHLEAARKEGDILVVTLTADRHVNKGPGRPIFAENLRAEMLAAVEWVDFVAVSPDRTAEYVLRAVRPDVYVKGSDYENPDDDITGKIRNEREAVEEHGGRLVFTKDITFSSSSLINRYLDVYDPPLKDLMDEMRQQGALARILGLIDMVADQRVVLVGEAIIDEYQYVSPVGKSPKENMIATRFESRERFAGGIIAAANHVASMVRTVDVVTVLGGESGDADEQLVRSALLPNVRLHVVRRLNAPTICKSRYVEPSSMRKLFEVQFMDDSPMQRTEVERLNDLLSALVEDADTTIVTDFGHGMIVADTVRLLSERARFLAVNAQSNSANMGFNLVTKYSRADYLCIDAPEARLATGEKFAPVADIAATHLPNRISCPRLILTHGGQGCYTHDEAVGTRHIPAFTKQARDTMGAGDAFLAVTSPLVAAGGDMRDVGFVGNAAGAIKVGIVGHRQPVDKVPLVKFITALLK